MTKAYRFSRVGYAYIPTTRLEESITWYTKHLEFKLISKFQDRGSLIAVLHHPHKHAIAVLLIETADRQPLAIARNGKPFPVLALQCPDIETTHAYLAAEGVQVEGLNSLGDGEAKYFYFRDNEGNMLEGVWSTWDPQDEYKEDEEDFRSQLTPS
jgi:catechol 2,3-dioxygenase-like lactoylglutathione lyase family enzyme